MFNKIIEFSIKNKAIIGFLVFVLIGFGIYSMRQIPVDAVPDITNNQVQIVTVSPSLSPQEVEKFITYPLEVSFANIMDVQEIRSISRYGLSVITVVFKEKVPILDARQLINEQIQIASGEIPEGLGKPEMLPITTGLGEVFQYTLEVEPEYKGQYSPTDLRTIQDWIVKRQLSGIHGIVEISSFGGYLKQYMVEVDPAKMKALDITISEVSDALRKNNENTGGSYIEKGPNAFYIRSEGLINSLQDIENIVIKNHRGTPVLMKHVGDVKFGTAPRFGAMTKDGEGEAVGGITLMLKGANSSQVINEVKERVAQVQESLPEGVYIHPYLDRAALVKKTTNTLAKNLIEGGLIVIFILVLLLGNLRSGIIVASVIPLSLLFSFIMMHIFGVSANLMSLGAIDFGIVIDGAVIIVESIIYHLHRNYNNVTLTQKELDSHVAKSTSSIYKSAAFGVFIILIVFVPILTLTGIEGKTFRPMAQTFMFAIFGAFILSITYVPMISSLFLKKKVVHKRTISDRFIDFLKLTYKPVLEFSLRFKNVIIAITIIVFAVSIWSFSYLGGEFIPTLKEGDLAMQMTIPSGSSLQQSIATTTKAEKILLDQFPEVKEVVSKIGTAEVPTDPMAVEDADIMIILKDKDDWVSADSQEELVNKMKEALEVIPAASFDFTQPIQLRFNELMTGVKTDIAVKIYGEDLDELFYQANQAADIIAGIPGAADIKVEQITGLPQYVIKFDRKKIARYGINIEDLNNTIRTAFAGINAGVVFEGERKFDLVVRLNEKSRKDVSLEKLFIRTPDGKQIPMSEVATYKYIEGPIQISRDNTKRRVTIGINVRNRDVESLVEEINQKLKEELNLKPGYYTTYTGQFENLKEAKSRLIIAVPIALLLILVLLFFTFNSVKYALLIFSAVPLSAVGGIAALWIRGMPFSISAGVGFIALFGVAVLNGIVLISYYNQLQKEGMKDIDQIVKQGALTRLRPVMMTAATDILGFLPMAISVSEGAEVQRPLATVVIGGIITSTLLTMIMLPILYKTFSNPDRKRGIRTKAMAILIAGLLIPGFIQAQNEENVQKISMEEAVQMALENNPRVSSAKLEVEYAKAGKKGAFQLSPTEFIYQKGQMNSSLIDQNFEITQGLGSIPAHFVEARLWEDKANTSSYKAQLVKNQLSAEVKIAYTEWLYRINRIKIIQEQVSLYEKFLGIARLQYELGESSLLEKTVAETSYFQEKNKLQREKHFLIMKENALKKLLFTDVPIVPVKDSLQIYSINKKDQSGTPTRIAYYEGKSQEMKRQVKLEKALYFPEISAGYFNQEIDQVKGFTGWSVGVSLPLWFIPRQSEVQKAKILAEISQNQVQEQKLSYKSEKENILLELNALQNELQYYHENALKKSKLIKRTAYLHYEKEEIEYYELVQSLKAANEIDLSFLEILKNYNIKAIELEKMSK